MTEKAKDLFSETPAPKKEPAAAPAVTSLPKEEAQKRLEELGKEITPLAAKLKQLEEKAGTPEAVTPVQKSIYEVYLDDLEASLTAKKRLNKIALKQTNENDWVLQNGQPYLEITGAEKIAPVFGVKVIPSPECPIVEEGKDEDGSKFVRYWYEGKGQIIKNGVVLYELEGLFGSASTRDSFFGQNKDGSLKDILDVNIRNVRYKAYSDFLRSAVVRLCGLRSVTFEELEDAGLKRDKIQDVKRGVEASPEDKKKQEELAQIARKLVGTDAAKLREFIKKLTYFKDGEKELFKENADQLTGKWLDKTLDKARAELAKVEGGAK